MEEDHDHPARPPSGATGVPSRRAEVENAFDLWLHRRLHQLYDSVTREPIPPELLQLIEKDRNAREH